MRRRLLDKTVKKTAVGNPAITTDSVTRSNIKLEMNGTTTQDGIPTLENPIEIINTDSIKINICGKNLFDPTNEINTSPDGGTSTIFPNEYIGNGEIKITAFNTKQDSRGKQLGYLKGRTITISCRAKKDNLSLNTYNNGVYEKTIIVYKDTTNKMTVSVPSDNYVICLAKVDFKTDYVIACDFQIEYGSIATDYEPYKPPQTITISVDRPISKFDTLTKIGNIWGINYKTRIVEDLSTLITGKEIIYGDIGNKYFTILIPNTNFNYDTNKVYSEVGLYNDNKENYTPSIRKNGFLFNISDEDTIETAKEHLHYKVIYETVTSEFIPLSQEQQELLNALYTNNPTTVVTNDIRTEITLTYKSKTR